MFRGEKYVLWNGEEGLKKMCKKNEKGFWDFEERECGGGVGGKGGEAENC